MTTEIGDTVSLRLTTRNALKIPTDVVSVALVITLPDLTTAAPTVLNSPGTGVYTATYVPTQIGQHNYRWTATDPTNGGTFADEFTVDDGYVPFVSLSAQLKFMAAESVIVDPNQLETLRDFIRIACESVELDLGRAISPQTITSTFDGGQTALLLRGPVLAVTTVVDGGTTLLPAEFVVDTAAGILYRGSTSTVRSFATGRQNVVITYRAGFARPPAVARKVAMNGALRIWQGSQQMPHPTLDDVGAEAVPLGVLTPLELAGYMKLKASGLA